MHTHHSDTDENLQTLDTEGQTLDELVAKGVEAAAKGENVEQILEVMLAGLPNKAKEKARKAFSSALAKKGLRQPSGEADIPSRTTLSRIRSALAMTTQQMVDRITKLLKSRPDLVSNIQQAGQMLVRNGVRNDQVSMTDADLGTMAPTVTVAKSQQRDQGAGRS